MLFLIHRKMLHERVDATETTEELIELSHELGQEPPENGFVACLAFMAKLRSMVPAQSIPPVLRNNVIRALAGMRKWINENISEDKRIMQHLRISLLMFEDDWHAGDMTKVESFLWCTLLQDVIFALLGKCKTAQGCSYLLKILIDASFPMREELNIEGIRELEFSERYTDHVPNILKFMRNHDSEGVCKVTAESYENFVRTLQNMGPSKFKSRLEDLNDNGTSTIRKVIYNEEYGVFYVRNNGVMVPIIPVAYIKPIMNNLGMPIE